MVLRRISLFRNFLALIIFRRPLIRKTAKKRLVAAFFTFEKAFFLNFIIKALFYNLFEFYKEKKY